MKAYLTPEEAKRRQRERERKWRLANRERKLAINQRARQADPEKYRALRNASYRRTHPAPPPHVYQTAEARRAYKAAWARKNLAENPEARQRMRVLWRKSHLKHVVARREKSRIQSRQLRATPEGKAEWNRKAREWRAANPDKVFEHGHRRRVRVNCAKLDCIDRIKELRRETNCHWCGCEIHWTPRAKVALTLLTIDHVIPVSRGGAHAPDNLVAACYSCNASKGNKLVDEWTDRIKEAA